MIDRLEIITVGWLSLVWHICHTDTDVALDCLLAARWAGSVESGDITDTVNTGYTGTPGLPEITGYHCSGVVIFQIYVLFLFILNTFLFMSLFSLCISLSTSILWCGCIQYVSNLSLITKRRLSFIKLSFYLVMYDIRILF